MVENKKGSKSAMKELLFRRVHPVVGYAVFFGALAVAIGLGLIICL